MSPVPTPFDVEPLHPLFGARLHGLDLSQRLSGATLDGIIRAFEEYSVLVFPGH